GHGYGHDPVATGRVQAAVLLEPLTVQRLRGDLELLARHAEGRGEGALREGHAYRGRGRDARHHDNGEPPPSGATTNVRFHSSSFSDVHLRRGPSGPGRGWEKCYVLGKESTGDRRTRPSREGVRTAVCGSSAITPERQPLAALSRNLLDRLRPVPSA